MNLTDTIQHLRNVLDDSLHPGTVSVWWLPLALLLTLMLARALAQMARGMAGGDKPASRNDEAHRRAVRAHFGKLSEHDPRGRN